MAARNASPAASGVAAPPAALSPLNRVTANAPAATIATAPTAAPMTLPLDARAGWGRLDGRAAPPSAVRRGATGAVGGPNPPARGAGRARLGGLPYAAVAHDLSSVCREAGAY